MRNQQLKTILVVQKNILAFGALVVSLLWAGAGGASAAELPTKKIRVPGSTYEIELIQLPAGKAVVKDDAGVEKTVEIKPVWMSRTEITWDSYAVFYLQSDLPEGKKIHVEKGSDAQSRPSAPYGDPQRGWGREGSPACGIHPSAIRKYCAWLAEMNKLRVRLPSEAEWEYACRAGAAGPLTKEQLKAQAWYANNSDDQTHAVAEKAPNAWGFFDMLGNVAEWVSRADGSLVMAGGSFTDEADQVHAGTRAPFTDKLQVRDAQAPKSRSWLSDGAHTGFRIVVEELPKDK